LIKLFGLVALRLKTEKKNAAGRKIAAKGIRL
jgi:hypothetical protein